MADGGLVAAFKNLDGLGKTFVVGAGGLAAAGLGLGAWQIYEQFKLANRQVDNQTSMTNTNNDVLKSDKMVEQATKLAVMTGLKETAEAANKEGDRESAIKALTNLADATTDFASTTETQATADGTRVVIGKQSRQTQGYTGTTMSANSHDVSRQMDSQDKYTQASQAAVEAQTGAATTTTQAQTDAQVKIAEQQRAAVSPVVAAAGPQGQQFTIGAPPAGTAASTITPLSGMPVGTITSPPAGTPYAQSASGATLGGAGVVGGTQLGGGGVSPYSMYGIPQNMATGYGINPYLSAIATPNAAFMAQYPYLSGAAAAA